MSKKFVYQFSEGNAKMRELLGGKGANLAEMTNIGLPVPQGFTITTEACTQYYEDGRQINDEIMAEIMANIEKLEEITGKKFGDLENPLLVSVRSGARASMPGMMDTILNLGLNEEVVNVMAAKSNNPRWAWDCYRRFIQMYSDVVMEVGKKYFEQLIDRMKEARGVTQDVELTADDLKELAGQFKAEYKEKVGEEFPVDPKQQLIGAVKAVFRSWDNPRANVYRRDNDIPYSWGTAVNVQMMAFGNMGDDCGTGVAFTRDPATGEKKLMGEFLTNAQGIGLTRTEHMFFDSDRIAAFREMICADTLEERVAALAKLQPMQQADFEGIYEAMEGNPVTIRFLDPPLHEFVPTEEADIEALAKAQNKSVAQIKALIASLHEFNPMMGHRGCRLAVTYPEIAAMQTRAVINAAINVQKRHPEWTMVPEIMIPLVGEVKELKYVKDVVTAVADKLIADAGSDMKYLVGTMIEIPRAALTADQIATEAQFFSFGTNDLTQMTFGFSRDDAGKFLGAYYDKKIYENDPFARLDQKGVGKLVKMACQLGRQTRPDLHLGICGEHGGDPSSVEFCHKVGLDYVSCSPFRVPIARLAAAQAAIKEQAEK